jgi:hypothetical protein
MGNHDPYSDNTHIGQGSTGPTPARRCCCRCKTDSASSKLVSAGDLHACRLVRQAAMEAAIAEINH